MTKSNIVRAIPFVLVCLLLAGGGCVLEDKIIEVVITGKTCAEFGENEESETFVTPVMVSYGEEIMKILEKNDIDVEDIVSAHVAGATYGVTAFSHSNDWDISGLISVERHDLTPGKATLITYTIQSLEAALGREVPATMHEAGVAIVDQALQDFLDGYWPELTFAVENGDVDPSPSSTNRLVFTWKVCIKLQMVIEEEVETPDPF
jgi:hypothetical protein